MPDSNAIFNYALSFKTAQLDSAYHKDSRGNDLGFVTAKFYDSEDEEIATQLSADLSCVKTVVDFMPNFSYEVYGFAFFQPTVPSQSVYLWSIFAPGILDIPGLNGGLDLSMCPAGLIFAFQSDRANYFPYNNGVGTNRVRLILKHGAAVKCRVQLLARLKIVP